MTSPREDWLKAAQVVLRRLSLPAADQLRYLQELGVEGSIDELGLEFDDIWRPLSPLLEESDAELRDQLSDIHRALSNDQVPWDAGALEVSPEWHHLRGLARRAMATMSGVKIGVPGRILTGNDAGRFVEVVDDTDTSGGFLILTHEHLDRPGNGHDSWVETLDDVGRYLAESGWEIEWLNPAQGPGPRR